MNYRFFIFCAERDTIAHQRGGQRSEFRVQSSEFRVHSSGFRVQRSEVSFWLLASGFLIPYFLFHISYFFLFIHALVIGFWLLVSGFRLPAFGFRLPASDPLEAIGFWLRGVRGHRGCWGRGSWGWMILRRWFIFQWLPNSHLLPLMGRVW